MKRFVAILCIVFSLGKLYSQPLSIVQSKQAIEQKKYKKALKKIENGLEKDKKMVELNYLRAWAEFEMALQEEDKKEQQRAMRGVLKSLEKANQKDENREYRDSYQWLYKRFTQEYKKEGIEQHYRMQYTKALPFLETAWELSRDTGAYALMGLCFYGNKDFTKGVRIMQEAAQMMYATWDSMVFKNKGVEKEVPFLAKNYEAFNLEIFQVLGKHYEDKQEEDSALIFLEMGLDIFPLDYKLTRSIVSVINTKVNRLEREVGMNTTIKKWVDLGLYYQPNNSYFLRCQNNYYLARLGYVSKRGDSLALRSFDSAFWLDKQALIKRGAVNSEDAFLTKDSTTFQANCLQHFMSTDNHPALVYYFYKWYPLQYKTPQINASGLEFILGNPPSYVSQRLLYAVANDAVKRFPKNQKIKDQRYNLYKRWLRSEIGPNSWNYLFAWNTLMFGDFPKKKFELTADKQILFERGIDSFIVYQDLPTAWKFFHLLKEEFPKNALLDSFRKRIAIADFNVRYKGSRIYANKKGSALPAATGWNGLSKRCMVGQMPDSTKQKITDRINYFRQNAGIKNELALNDIRRQQCQEASVMYAPVGVFTREPTPETHICYSEKAAQAARFCQVIKDPNPAIAATVLMSDLKSEELFNRQYLLAPHSQGFGFGASENNSVFWMVSPYDALSETDSIYYSKRMVSWPPAGYCPRMFFFKKWSISGAYDFTGAEVSIESKSIGKLPCSIKVDKAPMLPYATLVFEPQIAPNFYESLKDGERIQVVVKKKGKELLKYETILFDPK